SRLQEIADHAVGDAFASARQADGLPVVFEQTECDVFSNRRTGNGIEVEAGLLVERGSLDALRSTELHGHRLAGAVSRRQRFRLERDRLPGQSAADVLVQVARVQLTAAF